MLSLLRRGCCTSHRPRSFLLLRHAHTRPNPYPYPTHPHPSPHQIFHLSRSATADQVKSRYYELVRIYHPDSPASRTLPPDRAQARFHAITAAYDALRGKRPLGDDGEPVVLKKDFHDLSTAMWRVRQRKKADLSLNVPVVDDKWKDRMMLGLIFLTVATFVAQAYSTRREALFSMAKHARQERTPESRTTSRKPPALEPALSLDDGANPSAS